MDKVYYRHFAMHGLSECLYFKTKTLPEGE